MNSPKPRRRPFAWLGSSPYLKPIFIFIAFAMGLFFMLMYNQSRIAQQVFDNAKRESQIRFLHKENAQLSEQLFKSGDLSAVRREAERFGMRPPLEGQIRRLRIPRQDYLTVGQEGQQGEQPLDWNKALNEVATYLQTKAEEVPVVVVDEAMWEARHGR